jgi:hypothetical protein
LVEHQTFSNKSGIAIVRRRASSNAIITTRAAVEVDDHRFGAVHQAMLDNPLEQLGVRQSFAASQTPLPACSLGFTLRGQRRRKMLQSQARQNIGFDYLRGNFQEIDVAHRSEAQLPRTLLSRLPVMSQFA